MAANNRINKGRSTFIVVIASVVVAAIVVRLFYLSVFKFDDYQKKVIDQLITENKVSAKRGYIYDANMNVLAANYTVYDISISPSKIAKLAAEEKLSDAWKTYYPGVASSDIKSVIANFLAQTLELDVESVMSKVNKTQSLYANIQKGVESEKADIISKILSV